VEHNLPLLVAVASTVLANAPALAADAASERQSAADQPVLEEVIVTGEFRPVDLDRAPSSISVIGAREIDLRGAQHLEDIAAVAPNLNAASGASRARYYQIRGIGERGQFEEPLNSSVGLLVDGVDFSGVAGVATLFDVSQVEVFRGPQGTRYGANALAGMINVRTNAPTEQPEALVSLEGANYDTYAVGGALSGPIAGGVLGRLSGQYYRSDGFTDNDFKGADDTGKRDELTVRGKLRWDPTDVTEVTAMLGRIDVNNGYDAFSLDNGRDTLSDQPGMDKHAANFGSLGLDWNGSERFSIETIATYADSKIDYGYDEDWVYVGFDPFEYSSTDRYQRDRRTGTFEIQLSSEPGGRLFGGSTDWVIGGYALTSDVRLNRDYTFLPERFNSDYEVHRYALFGQLESRLGDRVNLIGGLRYERHDARYSDSNGVDFDPDDDLWGGRLSLEYDLTDAMMAYASAAKGYKAGGFNTLGTLDEDLREYDPEDLYNLEIGIKGRAFGDKLGARVAGFYMWRDNMQVESSVVRQRPDGSSEFIQFVGNASDGDNYGMEAELEYLATARLTLFANVGLLYTRYDGYVNAAGEDLNGRDQAQAPKYQFFTSARYRLGNGFFVNGEVEGKGSYYFSDNHDGRSKSYQLYNLAAGFEGDGWTVTVWGRNLTDKDYYVRGFFFGNDPRTGYEPALYTQLGEPRRYGLTVDWQLR